MLRNGDFGELKKNTKKKKEPQVDLLKRKIASLGDDSLKQVKKKKKKMKKRPTLMIVQGPTLQNSTNVTTNEQKRKDAARKILEFKMKGKKSTTTTTNVRKKVSSSLSFLQGHTKDFNKETVKTATSRHVETYRQQKLDHVLKDMNRVVSREKEIEKVSDVHEIQVKAYGCQECGVVSEHKKRFSYCNKNAHNLYNCKATKRFFECKKCGFRVSTINQTRVQFPCKKCKGGSLNFRRAGLIDSGKYRESAIHRISVRGPEDDFSR
jgi:hypothetical protein